MCTSVICWHDAGVMLIWLGISYYFPVLIQLLFSLSEMNASVLAWVEFGNRGRDVQNLSLGSLFPCLTACMEDIFICLLCKYSRFVMILPFYCSYSVSML